MISGKTRTKKGMCANRALIVGAMFVGVAVTVAIWLVRITVGPVLGFVLVLGPLKEGAMDTRIGRESIYIIVNTLGVAGLNSSGRPEDDPFVGIYNFPWVILVIIVIITFVVAVVVRIVFRNEVMDGDSQYERAKRRPKGRCFQI